MLKQIIKNIKKLTSVLRSAKNRYYIHNFSEVKNDLRKTWCLIWSVTNGSTFCNNNIKALKIDDNLIADQNNIASKINAYFTNKGSSLAAQIT